MAIELKTHLPSPSKLDVVRDAVRTVFLKANITEDEVEFFLERSIPKRVNKDPWATTLLTLSDQPIVHLGYKFIEGPNAPLSQKGKPIFIEREKAQRALLKVTSHHGMISDVYDSDEPYLLKLGFDYPAIFSMKYPARNGLTFERIVSYNERGEMASVRWQVISEGHDNPPTLEERRKMIPQLIQEKRDCLNHMEEFRSAVPEGFWNTQNGDVTFTHDGWSYQVWNGEYYLYIFKHKGNSDIEALRFYKGSSSHDPFIKYEVSANKKSFRIKPPKILKAYSNTNAAIEAARNF